jgi:hypothetical protein
MAAPTNPSPLGYTWLAKKFGLNPIPHFVESWGAETSRRHTSIEGGRVREIYPNAIKVADTVLGHLAFALKNEGLHLSLLRSILPQPCVKSWTCRKSRQTGF